MTTALNNINAAQEAYAARGETVAIELVANGGFTMPRADISPVRAQLAHKAIQDIPEGPEATDVPPGSCA